MARAHLLFSITAYPYALMFYDLIGYLLTVLLILPIARLLALLLYDQARPRLGIALF